MIHFATDYMEGAHPEVMRHLLETNLEQTVGYGSDPYTKEAKSLIRQACGLPEDTAVYFLVGGTQTNSTVIDGLLAHHEGVLAAETGHINVHESGAIEATGHKVLTLPSHEGKVDAAEVRKYIADFYRDETFEHMVAPGMLYISQPTEYGSLYSLAELTAISDVCHEYNIPLYIDGARLGYALASDANDVSLQDVARLCDVFYIGGTKVGLLFGEAVVVPNRQLLAHFFPLVKQHGALMAKGRLQGIQFSVLFKDNLYQRIARHAIDMAMKLKDAFVLHGYRLYLDSPTNQQFFVLPNDVMDRLAQQATFEMWGPRGEKETVVRFVTSWATKEEAVDELISSL